MRNVKRQGQLGMVLIEAMVALVVIAAGILGMAKLNSFFIEVSGQAKARTQAVQLAESRLEQLRSLMVKGQFDAIANGSDSVYGYSASGVQSTAFSRSWTVANNGAEGREITVSVAWTDRSGIAQQVAVRSVVAWDDPGKPLGLFKGSTAAGSHASTPTGRAKLGEGTMAVDPSVTPNSDGLRKQQGGDGKWRLVDSSGKVLLTATQENEAFSEIAGNVYIDQNNLSSLDNEDVYIVISDASYCSMTPAKNPDSPSALVNLGTGSVFKYFSYRCYLGANWFGNIGVVRTDNANTNDRVCLGDPAVSAVSSSTKSDNRHPALGTSRMYRGYVAFGASYKSMGIGVQSSDSMSYTAAIYDGHDFLLTRITGNPVDGDCAAKLRLYDGTAPYQPFSTDALTHTIVSGALSATETAYLDGGNTVVLGSPGKFFCFTTTCPDPLPNAPAPQITINVTGTVTRSPSSGNNKPTLASMSSNSGDCTIGGGNGNNPFTFNCSFTGAGFTGGTWAGTITANTAAGEFICPAAPSSPVGAGSATPQPARPAFPTANTFVFSFTGQSVDAGNSTFNFKIGKTAGDC